MLSDGWWISFVGFTSLSISLIVSHIWFEYITPRGPGFYADSFSFARFWNTFNSLVVYIPNKGEGTFQYEGLMTSIISLYFATM